MQNQDRARGKGSKQAPSSQGRTPRPAKARKLEMPAESKAFIQRLKQIAQGELASLSHTSRAELELLAQELCTPVETLAHIATFLSATASVIRREHN